MRGHVEFTEKKEAEGRNQRQRETLKTVQRYNESKQELMRLLLLYFKITRTELIIKKCPWLE